MKFNLNKYIKGSALISALIVVLFISSIISIWIHQSKNAIRQQHIKLENQQALLLVEGFNIWAAQTLKRKTFHSTTPVLATFQNGQLALPKGWKAKATLVDAQSQFNINNINERDMQMMFFLLLQKQLKHIKKASLKQIFYNTIARIDPGKASAKSSKAQDMNPQLEGIPMINLSEWRQVKGVTPEVFKIMQPFLTALPEATPINLNTCDEQLIAALKPDLKKEDVKKILFVKGDEGFKKLDELFVVMQEMKLPAQNITINSQYFWLNLTIETPSKRRIMYQNLIYRRMTPKGSSPYISIIKQFPSN
jgi:general secretion pathway protein K